ncbi:Chromatin assembly factor 1 subunit [Coemansia javaensis]|uniref:Chromatin assembly factor 1 subunit n=1 Tax=Coemansia javaensis TaxID=2761396 RepID=A0A9W8LF22_9FUNG|nr:Chromatin assembly factor 1 subunit [Coemansia javaensis]
MRVKTVQINWHDKLPIFSVDFDHSYRGPGWRFATGGGDNNVRVWRLRAPPQPQSDGSSDGQPPKIDFLAGLNRHAAPVNVVRFSPQGSRLASAGDDGVIIIWRQIDGQPAAAGDAAAPGEAAGAASQQAAAAAAPEARGGNVAGEDEGEETWRAAAVLRGSLADICDLAWSPDGAYLASASVDNTARIWDARAARCVQVLADHTHYVQGVAWDPLAQFIATQSSDRSLRIYQWTAGSGLGEVRPGTDVARLAATHRSAPLPTAATSVAAEPATTAEAAPEPARQARLFHDDNLASFFRRPSISPDGRLLATAGGVHRGGNACHVWARDRLRQAPALRLPGLQRPVVAARWAPCEFDAPSAWAAGARRMVLAVASQSEVAVYDTACGSRAVGLMDGLHYAAITDMAWSADGSRLVVVSVDGFATVASLDHPAPALPLPARHDAPPPPPPQSQPQPPADSLPHRPAAGGPASAPDGRRRLAPTLVGSL